MRILLYLATNLAVMVLVGIIFNLLGFSSTLKANGVDLDLNALLVMCALFGMGGSIISLLISKWMAKRTMGVRVIDSPGNRDEQWLLETVAELAENAGVKMPEVGVFDSDQANAFATGWNKNDALVAVSSGLFQRFSRNETRAVLAHEIGHVANGDMVTLTLIQGVVNTFVLFLARVIGHTVDRVVFKTERGYGIGYYVVSFVADLILGFLASMIVMWFSRWREFRADAAGASLTSRNDMVSALQRLRQEMGQGDEMPAEMTAFAISGSLKHGLSGLLRSHPPLEDRIRALQSMN